MRLDGVAMLPPPGRGGGAAGQPCAHSPQPCAHFPWSGGALPSVRSVQDGDLAQDPLLEVYLLPTDRMERAGGGGAGVRGEWEGARWVCLGFEKTRGKNFRGTYIF